jgi:hypothetical protein
MIPQEFLYFLLNKDGSSYYLDNGVVSTTTTPTPIENSPDGWQDTSIKWERNLKYFGSFRAFTTPYKFVRSAAKMIRDRFYRYGIEDRIYLVIMWLDKTFGEGWVHKSLFKGELDLSQVEDELTTITVPIVEGDLYKLFKANETTVYEIPITGGPIVNDDGILLFESAAINVLDGIQMNYADTGHGNLQIVTVPLTIINREGTSSGLIFLDQDVGSATATDFAEADSGNTNPIILHLKGTVSFHCDNTARGNFILRFNKAPSSFPTTGIEIYNGTPSAGSDYVIPFDISISMAPGDKLVMEGYALGVGAFAITFLPNSSFHASFSNRYITTKTPTLRPIQLGQALLDKIAPGYTFQSDILSTQWDNLVVTSGDAIRGIANPVIKTSITDFFTSYDVPCNLSMSISGKVISFGTKAQSLDPTVVQDLGVVNDLKILTDKDFQYNSVAVGYPNLDQSTYESLNAKEEFNVTSTFTTGGTRVNKQLQLISVYHGSMYEQELARINLDGKDTTAASVDATIFFKLLEKTPRGDGSYNYLRPTYDSVTGLSDPASAYNVPISPKNCLLNHGNEISAYFFWQSGGKLIFQTSSQQPTLRTVKGSVVIDEVSDEFIGNLNPPLFLPLNFEFTAPMNRKIVTTMKNTPNGTFSFTYNDDVFYGFAKAISIQPANRPAQDTILIASAVNDVLKLIH